MNVHKIANTRGKKKVKMNKFKFWKKVFRTGGSCHTFIHHRVSYFIDHPTKLKLVNPPLVLKTGLRPKY